MTAKVLNRISAAAGESSGADSLLPLLRCPKSGLALRREGEHLVSSDGAWRYPMSSSGIVHFEDAPASRDARIQQAHYDRVAAAYTANLGYPHTQEYAKYLDGAMRDSMQAADLSRVAEICCGSGEGFRLFGTNIAQGVGVDISAAMLESARREIAEPRFQFVQGDATNLPLQSGAFDAVILNGGIHHVNDRRRLYAEVFRILRPGGTLHFREPCDDFLLWRAIRAVIYRLSPGLDHETEHPLRRAETLEEIESAGLRLRDWRTYGFFGFCFFMNSDILVFNRLFRFIPGIRAITRAAIALDDLTVRLPGLGNAGLQVVGLAERPAVP
jgi:ubiquinone/menaquinone biosynthesis C-methylase UbiE